MNITQATLPPELDGLARSMAYEFEYSLEVDLAINELRESLQNPYLPKHVLNPTNADRPVLPPACKRPVSARRKPLHRKQHHDYAENPQL